MKPNYMRWNRVYFRNLIEEACSEISDLKGEQGGWSVDDQEVMIYANSEVGTCIVAAYFYNSVPFVKLRRVVSGDV